MQYAVAIYDLTLSATDGINFYKCLLAQFFVGSPLQQTGVLIEPAAYHTQPDRIVSPYDSASVYQFFAVCPFVGGGSLSSPQKIHL